MSHGGYSKRYTSHLAVFVRQWLYPKLSSAVCCPNGVAVFTGVEPGEVEIARHHPHAAGSHWTVPTNGVLRQPVGEDLLIHETEKD
jgi:hypothetical protein